MSSKPVQTSGQLALDRELAFHRRMARPGVFVDIGAHVGDFVLGMADLPGVDLVAIEPLPHALATLQARTAACLHPVRVIDVALSDTAGSKPLHVPCVSGAPVWEWASLVKDFAQLGPASADVTEVLIFKVKLATLDSLGLTDVRAIKLDAEGAEYEVLRGGRGLLARDRPVVTVELEERHREGCTWAVPAFMDALGYDCFFELHGSLEAFARFDRATMQRGGKSPRDTEYSDPYINWFCFVERGLGLL